MNNIEFIKQVGQDIATLKNRLGQLTNLSTTEKNSLVGAVNEIKATIDTKSGGGATINDNSTLTTEVYSAAKVIEIINTAKSDIKNDLVNGSSAALDTFYEFAAALNNDPTFATTVANALNNRLRFDAVQSLTTAQKQMAASNLGIDDPTIDMLATYTTARGTI